MSRVKRPAFQWYPGDFQRDTGVQACSFEARGLWREMMDLMHDGEPYGHLTAGGKAISPVQLARMVGITAPRVTRYIGELEAHGVFSRTDTGTVYSRRMVRDEHHRNVRAAGGIKSLQNPNVPRPKDTEKDGEKDTFRPSLDRSSGGSPAVASAVASAFTSSTSKRVRERLLESDRSSFDELLSKIPEAERWASEIGAALDGMPGHYKATPTQMGRAIADYLASGKASSPKLIQFRRYIQVAGDEKPLAGSTALRARAETLLLLLPRYGFTQNHSVGQHHEKAAELHANGVITDLTQFRRELDALLPLNWLRDAKQFDRERSISRIAKAIASVQPTVAAA